jgi:hypothetical protein
LQAGVLHTTTICDWNKTSQEWRHKMAIRSYTQSSGILTTHKVI